MLTKAIQSHVVTMFTVITVILLLLYYYAEQVLLGGTPSIAAKEVVDRYM